MPNPFEMIEQTEIAWCWAAVGATISKYMDPAHAKRQCEIAETETGVNGCCDPQVPNAANTPKDLGDVLGHLNLLDKDSANFVLSFQGIQTRINAGLPVCARITWFGELNAHFVVIYGWGISTSGHQWVYIGDPFFGDSTILYDAFVHNYLEAGQWTDTFQVKAPNQGETHGRH